MNTDTILLEEDDIPRRWYNIVPDLPDELPPPIDPRTGEVMPPELFKELFVKELVRQEFSKERFIKIPDGILEAYLNVVKRPTPLVRARRLERFLRTPARIYFKREDVTPTGSHKLNTSIAQAYYAMREGVEKLTTETGAGQWGSALALATNYFGVKCMVFMVKCSYLQKPHRRTLMELWGADVYPSPSDKTEFGRKVLAEDPDNPGSLGIAISEAIESALSDEGTKYSLGSVLNHVLLHQTIIGQEAKAQFEKIDEGPDSIIGCVGGGSNFAGFAYPFIMEVLNGKKEGYNVLAVESSACPSLVKGRYEYDFGDAAGLTPKLKMYTVGHDFMPPPIHAGGLRYHGSAPSLSLLVNKGIVKARAYSQEDVFRAAHIFTRCEGIVPAPETAHAVKAAIDIALECKKKGEKKVIVFNFSGHGLLDLKGYRLYLDGALERSDYPSS
ncbi:MAG: TrpB-like pyridoxal phosphate-dependent enzyme [Candidatus Asgardarchaeia archaeon]